MGESNIDSVDVIGVMHVTCKDCGTAFTIEPRELRWLKERNLEPFRRCAECRKRRKEERQRRAMFAPPGEKRRPW